MPEETDLFESGFNGLLDVSLEFVNHCRRAATHKDILNALDILKTIIPFSTSAIFAIEIDPKNTIAVQTMASHSSKKEWWEFYLTRDLVKADPAVNRIPKCAVPIAWREEYLRDKGNDGLKHLVDTAKSFDLLNCITVIFQSTDSSRKFTSFPLCFDTKEINSRWEFMLEMLMPYAHSAVQNLFMNVTSKSTPRLLTNREREVLKWGMNGKTAWEIGKILFISERTVKFHLNNSYKKLNVVNRPQAIAKAMSNGLI